MLNITVICVGKIKEKFYVDAINEYKKRLKRFCDLEIIELKDEPIPDNASVKQEEAVLEREGRKILSKIPKNSYLIPLCIEGKEMSSTGLSGTIGAVSGENSKICFVIGGSLGLSEQVKDMANLKLSFSKMTFPHQLMRAILLEQVYRAFTILNNITYHK